MLLNKITVGFVIQTFDTDAQEWVSQSFIAGDQVDFETAEGDEINSSDFEDRVIGKNDYLEFEMKQPDEMI